jgi:hypothetical protein
MLRFFMTLQSFRGVDVRHPTQSPTSLVPRSAAAVIRFDARRRASKASVQAARSVAVFVAGLVAQYEGAERSAYVRMGSWIPPAQCS